MSSQPPTESAPLAGSADLDASGPTPPPDLPRIPKVFWSMHPDAESVDLHLEPDPITTLQRLGQPPFPRSGFPFIGLLATVYDHVVDHTASQADRP